MSARLRHYIEIDSQIDGGRLTGPSAARNNVDQGGLVDFGTTCRTRQQKHQTVRAANLAMEMIARPRAAPVDETKSFVAFAGVS